MKASNNTAIAARSRIPRLPAFLMLITVLFFIQGCGGQSAAPNEDPGESVAVELGAGPQRTDALVAGDFPFEAGTGYSYFSNTPGQAAPVDFDLEGPWDFDSGPSGATLSITLLDAADAPLSDNFPEASLAARSTWTSSAADTEHNFQDLIGSDWLSYGRVGPDERLRIYSSGVRALRFPLAVGDSWTENYTETENGQVTEIRAENLVTASGRLTVPAGSYEVAYLLQTRVTAEAGTGSEPVTTWDYIWFVPGVGRAAEIISLPGEEEPRFDSASSFYRLRSFRAP